MRHTHHQDQRQDTMARTFTASEIERIAEMYQAYADIKTIARELGCTPNNVNYQLDKLRKADPNFRRQFTQSKPTNEAMRRKFGIGIGQMHVEISKLSMDARVWLHTEAAKQGYTSVTEMVVDHFMENYDGRA